MSVPTVRSLRILIGTDWLLLVIGVPLALLLEPTLPPQLREFLAAESDQAFGLVDILQLLAMFLSIALWLAGSIGAFLLWRPARTLYLVAVITGVALTPFVGPSVVAPLATAFDEASQIVSGVVLSLLYFSPLQAQFQQPSATSSGSE